MKSSYVVKIDKSPRASVYSVNVGEEKILPERRPEGSTLSAAWDLFTEFSGNSTVHGVKYLRERQRHWSERVFWITVFFISVVGCSCMIWKIYDKWQTSPVIVSFAEKPTPIFHIPFPAVTICSQTKVRSMVLKFTDAVLRMRTPEKYNITLSEEELLSLEALTQVCNVDFFNHESFNSFLNGEDIVDVLRAIGPGVPAKSFEWISDDEYNDIMEVLTEEGICYTFNALSHSEMFKTKKLSRDYLYYGRGVKTTNWTLENGYETNEATGYPRRVLIPGERAGLNIQLRVKKSDLDYMCRGPVQGFKIFLHTPGEMPGKQYFRVPLKQDVLLGVKPKMITTSKGLVNYSPERRQCYFKNDQSLQFFEMYTQNNCEQECLADFTLAKCKCVKFYMPHANGTKICGVDDRDCCVEAETNLLLSELEKSLGVKVGEQQDGESHCNCLPACTSISYDAELTQADAGIDFLVNYLKGADIEGKQFDDTVEAASLKIFFKEAQFISSKRSELYDWTDFMANFGGLLGLFMGFSILSVVEILYYVSLRLFCNIKTKRNKVDVE